MVHVCVVPGCSNRSDRERNLSFYHLPLKNKKLLRLWIHKIGRKNLPLNNNSRVCSAHFENACRRRLRPDEVPVLNLPFSTLEVVKKRSPKKRIVCVEASSSSDDDETETKDFGVQVEIPDLQGQCKEDLEARSLN